MIRTPLAVLLVSTGLLLSGCDVLMGGSGSGGQAAQPGTGAQTTIIALQTWLMVEQDKAKAEGKTARADAAGNINASLSALRTEANCARRLQLATAVSTGLQAEFPNYQSQLGLGTNLVTVLASGYPGCQG